MSLRLGIMSPEGELSLLWMVRMGSWIPFASWAWAMTTALIGWPHCARWFSSPRVERNFWLCWLRAVARRSWRGWVGFGLGFASRRVTWALV